MMSGMLKKRTEVNGNEAGYALVIVLVLILMVAIVIVPLLLLMNTGLMTAHRSEERMSGFYAADAGIEDATYKILHDNDGLPEAADDDPLEYTITDINGNDVNVTIEKIWILDGLETPIYGTTPHSELVTVGQILDPEGGNGTYWIEMTYDGSLLGELKVDKVGAWLPAGFEYVQNSSGGITSHAEVPDNPTETAFRGGTALEWTFTAPEGIKFEELPPPGGGEPGSGEFPVKRILYFKFTPAVEPNGAFSWMRTTRHDVYLSWDLSSGVYRITSIAVDQDTGKETIIESYVARAQLYETLGEAYGDCRAIGQSLMKDADGDDDGIRDTLLFEASAERAEVTGILSGATIDLSYLYWSAWRRYPTDITGYSESELADLADEVDRARFKRPGESSTWVTADRVQILPNEDSDGNPHGWSYSCRADVTDLIIDEGNGWYEVREIDGITADDLDNLWSYAGWSLFIIYRHDQEDAHQLYLYDDFLYVDEYGGGTSSDPIEVALEGIEGFLVPPLGPGDEGARLTIFVGEGDWCYTGDYIEFNSNRLPHPDDPYDGGNPQNNVWNDWSAAPGAPLGEIDGVDIDTFDATPFVAQGQTSADVVLGTATDSWNLVYVILSFRTEPGTNPTLFPVSIITYTYEQAN